MLWNWGKEIIKNILIFCFFAFFLQKSVQQFDKNSQSFCSTLLFKFRECFFGLKLLQKQFLTLYQHQVDIKSQTLLTFLIFKFILELFEQIFTLSWHRNTQKLVFSLTLKANYLLPFTSYYNLDLSFCETVGVINLDNSLKKQKAIWKGLMMTALC